VVVLGSSCVVVMMEVVSACALLLDILESRISIQSTLVRGCAAK
jgi:hypothetical protein